MNDATTTTQAATPLPSTASPILDLPATEPAPTITKSSRKHRSPTYYDRMLESVAHFATLFAALLLWWIGAQFTLEFLGLLSVPLHKLGAARWLIPIAITAIEIKYWPTKRLDRNLLALFAVVAGIDLLTSIIGGHSWLAGRAIGTLIIPDVGWLWIAAGIGAIFSAFWPEKLARAATRALRAIWLD